MTPRRGYTLTELVVASAITLAACLGGATAVRVAVSGAQKSRVEKSFVAAVARADEAAPRGLCETLRALGGSPRCDAAGAPPAFPLLLAVTDGKAPLQVNAAPSTHHAPLWELTLSVRPSGTGAGNADGLPGGARPEEVQHVLLVAR